MLKPKKYNSGCMVLSPLSYKKGIMACAFSLLFGAGIFLPAHFSYAADIVWTGATSSDWAVATNWSTGVIPTAADNVTIPDATTTINDPSVASGAVCSNLTIALGGLLNGNAQTITVNGNWNNAGTFNHGSGKLVFAGAGGASTLTPGTSAFYDLELNKTNDSSDLGTLYLAATVTVSHAFIQTDGELGSGQLDVAGDYTIAAGSGGVTAGYSAKVNLNGAGNQAVVCAAGGIGAKVRIDKASGTLAVPGDVTVAGWEYVLGAVTGTDTHTFTFGDNTSGVFIPGNFAYGNIILDKTFNASDYDYLAVVGTANVVGNFTHNDGTTQGGQMDVAGNYVINSPSLGGERGYAALTVNLNGAGNQAILCSAGGVGDHVRVDKASGTLNISSAIALNSWTYVRGTVAGIASYALSFEDDTSGTFLPGGLSYGGITVNKTAHADTWDQVTVGAGALTVSGNLAVTEGKLFCNANNNTINVSGNVVIGALGTFSAGTNSVTVNGNWTNAGTFNHGNGMVVFGGTETATLTPGVSSFYDLVLNKTYDYGFHDNFALVGTVEVAHNLTHTDGEFANGQINVAGNYIIAAKSAGAPSGSTPTIVNLNGAGDQEIVYTVLGVGDNVRIDKASGTLTLASDIKVNGWNYVRGAVAGLDEHVLIFGDDMIGTFVPGNLAYAYVEINKTSHTGIYDNVSVSGTVNLTGNLIHTEGEFNGGQIDISAGDYIVPATADGAQSGSAATIINFNGAGDQSVVYGAGGVAAHIRIDKPSGTLNVADGMIVHDWTYVRGSVPNMDSYTLVLGDNGQGYFTPGSLTYGNIEIYKTEHNGVYDDLYLTAGALPTIKGNLYLREGHLRLDSNNPSINLGGDFAIGNTSATFAKGTGTITLSGAAPSTFTDASATPQNIGKVAINKSNADISQNTLTLASSLTCDTMTVNSGSTLKLGTGGHVFTLANVGTAASVLTLGGTLDGGDGTVKYAATNSAGSINIAGGDYNSLELSGNETYVLTNDTSVLGNLTIGSLSTLNTATYDINLGGNLSNSGAFTPNTNAVMLTGTNQTLSGNTTFYDFTKTITVADALTFQSGSITTVTHALTLKGESRDNRLTLQSSVPDSAWSLTVDPLGTYDFDSLAVFDSVANRNLSALNSLDQGGNSNWTLVNNTAPTVSVPTIVSSGSIAIITATLSDNDADNLTLKVEYSLDGGASWLDPDLSSVTASSGSPILSNSESYQLSGIPTTSSNTLVISWDTTSPLNQGGYIQYCDNLKVRLSPYDNTDYGASQISGTFTIDNRSSGFIAPAKPNLSDLKIVQQGGVLSFENLPENIQQVAVSASPDFADVSFQELSAVINVAAYASDTAYLKFRTERGAISDVIVYSRASGNTSQFLDEGDIVKTVDNPDVYIIKYKNGKQYKRLILSPSVFGSYRHLKWDNLKVISQSQLDSFMASDLVQVAGDSGLYELTPLGDTGKRRLVSPAKSYDADSIYEINAADRNSYILDK